MNLRTKLLAGFSLVVAIVLAMGIYMSISITDMSNQAKTVDAVDSALTDTLIGQGSVLRFLLYHDQSYLTKAKESFDLAKAEFNRALTTMTIVANREILKTQQGNLDVLLQRVLVSQDVEKKRLEIENRMTPITVKLTADLQKLRMNVGKALAADFSQELWDIYNGLVEIGENFREARIAARIYTITQTPENEKIAFEWFEKTSALTKTLQSSVTDSENDKLIKDVVQVVADYETSFRQLIANAGDNKDNNVAIRQAFETITNGCMTSSANATKALLSFGNDSQFSMYAGTTLIIILCIVIALLLTRNVLRQLGKDPGELAHIAQRVTEGDFNIDDGSARIGVYGNIVSMVKRLQETITHAQEESQRAQEQSKMAQEAMQNAEAASKDAQSKTKSMLIAADKLESVASIVSSASSELSAQIEQSERGASEQASRVTETATAMEEMNSTVLEVAKNASAASDVSTSTRQKAEAGAEVVRQAVASIQEVQQQSIKLKADMNLLDENAKAVSQIMGVISDIADQTNLLALNAAIEAARAGEAGRGFAVVADEVRKLAEKTMASTTDVGNAIRAIQSSAAQSMSQVDASVRTIEQATEFANRSGVALNEIVTMVDNTADQVRAIATASEQQSASSEEINQSIMQVNTIAGETARAMEEAARAVSDLATQAHVLTQLIEEMKRG